MMDSEALRTFVAIRRTGGVSRAAGELFRSQPAISRRLALLEQELGVALFERVGRAMALTDAGKALLPFAERALAVLADAEAAVAAVRTGVAGPIGLALVGTLANARFATALRGFARDHPAVELDVRTATSHEVSDLVRRGEATMGLRYSADPARELRCEQLFTERMVVVVAADAALAGARGLAATSLAGERWIAFPRLPNRPEASEGRVQRTLDRIGVAESRVLRIDSLTAQKRLVEAGFGIALVPRTSVEEELASRTLAVVQLADLDVSVPVTLVTRRDGFLGPAALALREHLRRAAPTVAAARRRRRDP